MMTNNLIFEPEKQKLPKYAQDIISEIMKLGFNSAAYSLDLENLPVISIVGTSEKSDAVKVCFYQSYGWQNPGSFRVKVSSTMSARSCSFPLRIDGTYNYQLIAKRVMQFINI
jgi:hypothetical protein